MSAQNSRPKGVLSGLFGMLGFSVIAGILVTVMVTPALAVTGVTATNGIGIFDSLPEFIEIGDQPQANKIFVVNPDNPDGSGYSEIAQVYDQNRQEVQWDQVSQFLKDAAVAGEDRRFYDHGGVDLQGLVRAAIGNAAGGETSGASTLSMQLVKNIYIQQALKIEDPDQQKAAIKAAQAGTFGRKVKEMKLAIGLEKQYSKDDILLAYLNIAGFGGNNYGVETAAQRYFSTSSANVTLAQAASLIAIVQEPSTRSLDAAENYPANQERRDVILRNMFVEGMVTQEQLDEALATPVTPVLKPYSNGCLAAEAYSKYFCDYVTTLIPTLTSLGATEVERQANWKTGGYKLYTTMDLRLQTVAQDTVEARAPADETRLDLGASVVSVQPGTGKILTMAQNKKFNNVGTASASETSVNFNTDRPNGGSTGFQVGSTYKLFTLLNWLEAGNGLNDVVLGTARPIPQASFVNTCDTDKSVVGLSNGPFGGSNWTFKNSAGEAGNFSVLDATKRSINGAYASMGLELDQCRTKEIALALGVHTAQNEDLPDSPGNPITDNQIYSNPSAIIGTNVIAPLTMAAAYAGIANHGIYCAPVAVTSIVDASGTSLPGQPETCSQAIAPEVAATAVYALKAAMTGYAGNPNDGTEIFGKTGTTDSSNQTWLMSSTTAVTTAVWFGNIQGSYSISRYPNGINNRHLIAKPINQAADRLYPGGSFDAPSSKLITGSSITLPDFVGGTPENAKSVATGLKLQYADGGAVDSALPAGVVASTSPAAGSAMGRGATVTVYTSNGSLKTLPDVVSANVKYDDAKAALAAAGFTSVDGDCVAVGAGNKDKFDKVVSSNPAPGTEVNVSTQIKLGVAKEKC